MSQQKTKTLSAKTDASEAQMIRAAATLSNLTPSSFLRVAGVAIARETVRRAALNQPPILTEELASV